MQYTNLYACTPGFHLFIPETGLLFEAFLPLKPYHERILNYLSQTYWKLTEEVMTYVLQHCDELTIPEGEIVAEEGKVCRYVWFIKKGLLGAYQDDPWSHKKFH